MRSDQDEAPGRGMTHAQRALFGRARGGDDAAMSALIDSFEALIQRVINQRWKTSDRAKNEDMLQEGRIGALKAIRAWDESRGITLGHVIATYAMNQVSTSVRRSVSSGFRPTVLGVNLDLFTTTDLEPVDPDEGGQVRAMISQLPDRLQAIVRDYYGIGGGEPKTAREISAAHGCTHQRISQLHLNALEWLREIADDPRYADAEWRRGA